MPDFLISPQCIASNDTFLKSTYIFHSFAIYFVLKQTFYWPPRNKTWTYSFFLNVLRSIRKTFRVRANSFKDRM